MQTPLENTLDMAAILQNQACFTANDYDNIYESMGIVTSLVKFGASEKDFDSLLEYYDRLSQLFVYDIQKALLAAALELSSLRLSVDYHQRCSMAEIAGNMAVLNAASVVINTVGLNNRIVLDRAETCPIIVLCNTLSYSIKAYMNILFRYGISLELEFKLKNMSKVFDGLSKMFLHAQTEDYFNSKDFAFLMSRLDLTAVGLPQCLMENLALALQNHLDTEELLYTSHS